MDDEGDEMMKKITKTTLEKWDACADGYARFNELFPRGADLKTASEGLIKDGHPDWSNWLWSRCKQDDDYIEQTVVTAGTHGTATAGDEGTATAGYRGTATAGYRGIATAGDRGAAIAGDFGNAIAGYRGTATAGNHGTTIAGNDGSATAGNYGTATAGYSGTATAGYRGIATAGDRGAAIAGDFGNAIAGYRGTATAGEEGCISIQFWNKEKEKYCRKIGLVTDGQLKANTPYKLDENGEFIEVTK